MNYTPEQKANWDKALSLIEESTDKLSYVTWFKPLRLYAISGETMYILGTNSFTLQHMRDRYGSTLTRALDTVFKTRYQLEYHTTDEISLIEEKLATGSTLNPKYTFENFVVGDGNRFAHAAALAVADSLTDSYNPLFIYGGVGLGKTHLLNAIGNYVLQRDPSKNVLLMTSEAMTNQLIDSIGKKNTAELRARLRGVEYLMVDDIQFLGKTRMSQEEFFNTFNDLRANHKQIIISSDRPPRELPEIEERLRSRFEWGLIVDVQKPDFETRVAILRQKAIDEGWYVPNDVMQYIAHNVNSNIRALEGSLASLKARSDLMGSPIDMDMTRSALENMVKAREKHSITCELIIEIVASKYGMQPAELTGKRRSQNVALARQVAMYICREMTDMSTIAIGKVFGRDHTTVLHGCEKIESNMQDYSFRKRVDEIMKAVKDG
ncbi:MAG: chromosomal replication initiator protein DnaA [bacterium]